MIGNRNPTGGCTVLPRKEGAPVAPLILVVEEQPAIQELLRSMLHLAGYRVTVCADRQAALTWREQAMTPGDDPVALLLDLGLLGPPESSDFLRRVRERWQKVCPVLPQIIALTTHPQVQAELGARERVLLKPFHVRDLLALIQQGTSVEISF